MQKILFIFNVQDSMTYLPTQKSDILYGRSLSGLPDSGGGYQPWII